MMSSRLKWAVSAQLVASAALVSPTTAHWNPEDCPETNPPPPSLRVCDEDCADNFLGGGEYIVEVDGYVCTLWGEPTFYEKFSDFATEEEIADVCEQVMEECHDWRDGSS